MALKRPRTGLPILQRNTHNTPRLTGHKTIAMTMRYAHLSDSHLRAAVNQIWARLGQNEEGLDGQSHKLRNYDAPVAQLDRASDF